MKIAFSSTQPFERIAFNAANQDFGYTLEYYDWHLNESTVALLQNYPIVSCFVNDTLNAATLKALYQQGTRCIALRSAGYNHVDIEAAKTLGITVARVPAYSPYAVAEHTVGLILALNRQIHRAYARVREQNFSLHGLMGFDLHGKTVGIIGLGKIGIELAKIMQGFGCKVLGYDPAPSPEAKALNIDWVDLPTVYAQAHIISLNCPLTVETRHLINSEAIAAMRPKVMLINTSRGAVIDTKAVIEGLKSGKIGYLGLDVYEEEAALFFEDRSDKILQDDLFARLQTFPNVIITAHQAFFTEEAVHNIALITLENIHAFVCGKGQLYTV